jgi:hypothetical protein
VAFLFPSDDSKPVLGRNSRSPNFPAPLIPGQPLPTAAETMEESQGFC